MHHPDIGHLLNAAARHVRVRFAEALVPDALTPQQAAAILAVGDSEDHRMTPTAIAEAIGADPATTTGLVERLARDGWITVSPNPADRRSRLVAFSPQAESSLPRLRKTAHIVSAEITADLNEHEIATLCDLLARVCGMQTATLASNGERA